MKKNFLYLVVVSLFMTFFASCSSDTSATLIPEDAAMVVSFNIKDAIGTIDNSQIEKLSKELKKYVKDADFDRDVQNKINEYIEDPMSIGVNISKPVYFSMDVSSESPTFIGSIKNNKAFESTMEYLASECDTKVCEEGDVKYVAAEDVIIMFNGKSFVVGEIPYEYNDRKDRWEYDEDGAVENMKALFTQKKSFADTKSFALFEREKGLVKMVMTPEIFSNKDFIEDVEYGSGLDASEIMKMYRDMSVVAALNVDKGEITLSSSYDLGENKDAFEEYASMAGTIEGTYLPYVSEDATFVAAANINGMEIWNVVSKAMKSMLDEDLWNEIEDEFKEEFDIEIKDIVKSFNGDITLVMDGNLIADYDDIPELKLYASTSDNKAATAIAEYGDMDEVSNNKWETTLYDYDYDYEYDNYDGEYRYVENKTEVAKINLVHNNNTSCISLSEKDVKLFNEASKKIDKSAFTSNQLYARLNVQSLLNVKSDNEKIKDIIKDEEPMALKAIEAVDYIDLAVKDNRAKYSIFTKDDTRTPIDIIAEFIIDML